MLFHRSLAESIAYARPDASRAEIEEAARLAHADVFISRLPDGYSMLVGECGIKLSGGPGDGRSGRGPVTAQDQEKSRDAFTSRLAIGAWLQACLASAAFNKSANSENCGSPT